MDNGPHLQVRLHLTNLRIERMLAQENHPGAAIRWQRVKQILQGYGAWCENDPFNYQWYARFPTERQALLFVLKYG